MEGYIAGALKEGATLYFLEEQYRTITKRLLRHAHVVSDVMHGMTIAKEEVFGLWPS